MFASLDWLDILLGITVCRIAKCTCQVYLSLNNWMINSMSIFAFLNWSDKLGYRVSQSGVFARIKGYSNV